MIKAAQCEHGGWVQKIVIPDKSALANRIAFASACTVRNNFSFLENRTGSSCTPTGCPLYPRLTTLWWWSDITAPTPVDGSLLHSDTWAASPSNLSSHLLGILDSLQLFQYSLIHVATSDNPFECRKPRLIQHSHPEALKLHHLADYLLLMGKEVFSFFIRSG